MCSPCAPVYLLTSVVVRTLTLMYTCGCHCIAQFIATMDILTLILDLTTTAGKSVRCSDSLHMHANSAILPTQPSCIRGTLQKPTTGMLFHWFRPLCIAGPVNQALDQQSNVCAVTRCAAAFSRLVFRSCRTQVPMACCRAVSQSC